MAHYIGHHQCVRQKCFDQGLEGFQDCEAIELLLFSIYRQQDTKEITKKLIGRFGSFRNVLNALVDNLHTVESVGRVAAAIIHFVKHSADRYCSRQVAATLPSRAQKTSLTVNTGSIHNEEFCVLGLDGNFAVIVEQDIAQGTISQAAAFLERLCGLRWNVTRQQSS